jgi:hypothetical protein
MGGVTGMAQIAQESYRQLQWSAMKLLPPAKTEIAEAGLLGLPPSGNPVMSPVPAPIVRNFKLARKSDTARLGAGFFLLNGLNIGMTALDMGLSQNCIAQHRCREANALMPSSLAARVSIVAVFTAFGTYVSHRMKKHGNRLWWVPPLFGTAAHGVGVASGLAQQ